jgi:hypothetical protein
MRKILFLVACMASSGSSIAQAPAVSPSKDTCTVATLHGTLAGAGWATNTTNSYLHSGSWMESYDGKGHFKYYEFYTDSSGTTVYSGAGTYEMDSLTDASSGVAVTASCIAKVVYFPGGVPWTYFVAPDGSAYYYNDSRPNTQQISGGRADRISFDMLVK